MASAPAVSQTCNASDLKTALTEKIPVVQEEVKAFRKQHGNTKVGEITVDMMYGGMRGMKGLVTETSVLDAEEGELVIIWSKCKLKAFHIRLRFILDPADLEGIFISY